MRDPYQVLGVSQDASEEEIKKGISETEPDVSSGCQYNNPEQGAGGRKI